MHSRFAVLTAALCLSFAARAGPQVRLGADALLDGGPALFSLQLGVETALARDVSVGGRFGALVTTAPTSTGVPLDLALRVRPGGWYFEGLVGPWIFFSGQTLRAHGAVGFGLSTRAVDFGLEVGWLSSGGPLLGARVGLRI
jgi:hypothetical protein